MPHTLVHVNTDTVNLREFVLNSRHPDPRRVWKGGSEPRLLTPDPEDPLDPADPLDRSGESIFVHIHRVLRCSVSMDPPQTLPNHVLPQAWPITSSGRPWGSLWECLEELCRRFGKPCGSLWELLGSPGGLWESSGRLYIDELPINRTKRPLCYSVIQIYDFGALGLQIYSLR